MFNRDLIDAEFQKETTSSDTLIIQYIRANNLSVGMVDLPIYLNEV